MKIALRLSFWTTLLMMMTQGAFGQLTSTWTGGDPSGYWSAPANWSPAGVPVNGNDLVFPGGLPPGDMVSTNDLTDSIFRSIRFDQGSRHTIRGNPITLTNRADVIINSGTNVIACDLTFTGTPPTPDFQYPTIRDSGSGELTVIGNVGGGSLSFLRQQFGTQPRWVIRGQFTGGSLRVGYGTLALYGDNPNAVSAVVDHSTLLVQGSQPNLNIRMFSIPPKTLLSSYLSGDGQIGDVTGGTSYLILDSTLAARNVSVTYLYIYLNGTNVGQYGRLVASGNVSASSGFLSASAGFNPQAGQIYTIVEKTSPGPVTSAFFGPEGSVTTLNGTPFRLSYVGGDGNDVTLTAMAPPPTVTVVGSDATASESGDSGMYTITRTGSTASSLTINYTLSGTAQNGTDYNSLSGSVTIPAGANSATVSVVPMDDTALEGNETVTLTLAANSSYTIGSPDSATVTIVDNEHPPTITWTGADPSGYWSAPANWSPAGVPVNGTELVFPGGLPPEDLVSTNDLTDSIFRSIRFLQASRHTIRGNPITLTNRADVIINSGTNVIACDLTFSGTPSTPEYQYPTIRGSFGSGELTVIGNVGGGSLYFLDEQFGTESRLVIRGQFTGGSVRVNYATLALYGDNPHAVSAEIRGSQLLVQGSQPNLNITLFSDPFKTLTWGSLRGDGQVGDVAGYGFIVLDSTLSVRNASAYYLNIILNGTNVGEYGRLVASGDVSPSSGYFSPSAGFNPEEGQVFTIVEKTSPGPIKNAVFGPEGSVTLLNGMPFRISYVGGDGNDVTLTATDTSPTVTITNPPNGAVFDAPASFTLGASAADPGGSVTNVQFFLGATSLGNDTSSPYSVPVSGLVAGNYTLTAVASDDAGTHATNSIAITVQPNMPPTVTITNPPNGAVLDVLASFTLGAAAADPGGSVSNVQFFLDGTSLGNDTSSPYSVAVSGLVAGNYALSAVASDNAGARATNSIAITVQPRTEWDVSQDFSLTANPGGPWSYGYMNVLGGAFSLLTYSQYSPDNNGLMVFAWSKNGYEPVSVYKNQTSQTSISDGGSGNFPPGTVWFFGGIEGNVDNYGVIRFTVPADKAGAYRVETAVRTYLDGAASRDADFWVLKNGTQVFSRFLGPNSGAAYTNIFTLAAGDTIDFVCGRGQDNMIHGSGLKIQATLTRTDQPPPTNTPPVVTWLSPPDGASFPAGSKILLSARATNSDATVSFVEFFADSIMLGRVFRGSPTNTFYYMTWSNAPAGTHQLHAEAVDNAGNRGISGSVQITVSGDGPTNTPPSVTITNPVNDAVFIAPATFTVEAAASDPDGNVSHVGFFLNSTSLGADMVSPYSVSVNNLPAGTYTLRAVATDDQNAKATNSITVIVNAPPPFDPTFRDANWSSIPGIDAGFARIQDAVVDRAGNLYIAGSFTISGDVLAENIAKWNGSRWSALGSTALMTNLSALAVSGSDLYVGGDFRTAGGTSVNSIAKWNGTNWSALGSGMGGSVYALAVSGSNLYAGGWFRAAGGTWATNIAKWDGNSWSPLGLGMWGTSGTFVQVRALAVSGSNVYAGGNFTTAGGSPANRIAKWDGSSWSALGAGLGLDYVFALAVLGSDVYAGGGFTTAGGSPANYIAKWNGSSWSALGSGMNSTVFALAVLGGDVYAGGGFTTAGGGRADRIAKWDGITWNPLGSGMSGSNPWVVALAVSGSSLYAGGWFTTAGDKVSPGIAKARIASAAESITRSGSSATIQFSGVVGYQYHVQRTVSLISPMTWTTLTTTPLSPAVDGSLTFTDTTAPPGTAYYRLVQH